jgi:two-component system cell cycle sensor histidine kinase/response regulator CckA
MLAAIPGLEPGPHLRLVVSDTGTGMTPEVRAHLFEPFFTTKPLGTGTGLGLATVYGVVRQSGGAINCTSSVGAGTRFELYLPLVAGIVVGEGSVGPEPPAVGQGNTRSVLVVDDEATVCGAIARLLRRTGYRAATATSGEEALLVLEAADGDFDLLLTDFAMPGMNGRELLAAARARWPWLNVLLMSAFTPDEEMRRALRDTATPFLAKPFTLSELLETVRAMNPRPRSGA